MGCRGRSRPPRWRLRATRTNTRVRPSVVAQKIWRHLPYVPHVPNGFCTVFQLGIGGRGPSAGTLFPPLTADFLLVPPGLALSLLHPVVGGHPIRNVGRGPSDSLGWRRS